MKKKKNEIDIDIVNKAGLPFEDQELSPATREQIATNIFNYSFKSDSSEEFLTSAGNYILQQGVQLEDGKFTISAQDPQVHEFCILYATEKVMDHALDEEIGEAYALLAKYTHAPKYTRDKEVYLDEDDIKELNTYYANVPELLLAKQICDIQLEITQAMTGQSGKCLTSYQANRIQEKFDELVPFLHFEQRAAGYYNISIIHRALLAEKDYYDPAQNNAEKDCLKKVLEYTSDYNRINYCINRLGPSYPNQGSLRAAYRRALTQAASDNDLYRINRALAQCYVDDYHPKIGFQDRNLQTFNHEEQKLERAEMYFYDALKHAPEPEKITLLKDIGRLQLKQNKINEWTDTQTTLAMEYMAGEERCHTLMEVAFKNQKLQKDYLAQVVYEAARDKNMSKPKKSLIIKKAATYLQPIYEKENNQEGLEFLQKNLQKYALGEYDENPLLRYKKKKNSR